MAGGQYTLDTAVFLTFCSMQTSAGKGLEVGEKNNFSEGDPISVSDQSLGQLKAGGEGWEGSLCWRVWSVTQQEAPLQLIGIAAGCPGTPSGVFRSGLYPLS